MFKRLTGLLLFMLCFDVNAQQFDIKKIEVFSDGMVQVPRLSGVEIIVYDLNEITEINKPVHFDGGSLDRSKAMLNQWLASEDYKLYLKQRRYVMQPLVLMSKYGVSKIPAIVFNSGEFAVYGTTDVNMSIKDIQHLMTSNQP